MSGLHVLRLWLAAWCLIAALAGSHPARAQEQCSTTGPFQAWNPTTQTSGSVGTATCTLVGCDGRRIFGFHREVYDGYPQAQCGLCRANQQMINAQCAAAARQQQQQQPSGRTGPAPSMMDRSGIPRYDTQASPRGGRFVCVVLMRNHTQSCELPPGAAVREDVPCNCGVGWGGRTRWVNQ